MSDEKSRVERSEAQWREQLTPEQYHVCREKGTEPAFTGKYWECKDDGIYRCACCGNPLFDAATKFDSGTGWPSFTKPADGVDGSSVEDHEDRSHGMLRTEVTCSRCDAHLGHVFPDGPNPTGLRYCIKSASLDLKRK